jgi:hypothetical protein
MNPTIISNALDLHRHALGQLLHRDAAARGLVRKVLSVDAVHLGEVRHVGEEDVDFYDALDADAGRGEDRLDVVDAGFGLVCDGACDEVAVFVGGDAAGDVDVGAGDDGVGLGLG